MAQYFNGRYSLKYEQKKQLARFDNKMKKYARPAIKKKWEELYQLEQQEIESFRSQNQGMPKKEFRQMMETIRASYKKQRQDIEKRLVDEQQEKYKEARKLIKTTHTKDKIIHDELDPGIVIVGNKPKRDSVPTQSGIDLKKFHNELLDKGFFSYIENAFNATTDKEQTAENLLIKTLQHEQINYTRNIKAKTNQNPSSMLEAYKNIEAKGMAVGYDLETIGGKSIDGVWKPNAITEYSFQFYDTKNNKIVKDVTALVGMDKGTADKLYEDIVAAMENGTLKDNNELFITANRMMKYGHRDTKVVFDKDTGLSVVTNFVDEDAVTNTLSKEQIYDGLMRHVEAYNADKSSIIPGMKDYDAHFLNTIAEIKKRDLTVIGFNDLDFDSPIIDSQINRIRSKYKDNDDILEIIDDMFGKNGKADVKFNPAKNRRIDMRSAANIAVDVEGYQAVYGKTGINSFLNELALNDPGKMMRQEFLAARHFKSEFEKGAAHSAGNDVGMLLRLGLEPSEIFKAENENAVRHSLLGNLMGIIEDAYGDKTTTLDVPKDAARILYSRRNSKAAQYTGRALLSFSVDPTNGGYNTAGGYMVGSQSKAMSNTPKQNIRIGGHIEKNQYYEYGGIQKFMLTDEFIEQANIHVPEYARREVYALRLDKLSLDEKTGKMTKVPTYMLYNELAEAEGLVSSQFVNIGKYYEGQSQHFKETKAVQQVYGKDVKHKSKLIYDKKIDLMPRRRGEDGNPIGVNLQRPQKAYKLSDASQGVKLTNNRYTLKSEKDMKSPKGYTFDPEVFGGSSHREGILVRKRANIEEKYVIDPDTGLYHPTKVIKEEIKNKKGKVIDTQYRLKVDSSKGFDVSDFAEDELETVYNRKNVLYYNQRRTKELGDNEMKPLFTNNGQSYYMQIGNDNGENTYVNYFEWEKYKHNQHNTPRPREIKESEFNGNLKPAHKVYKPSDKRFELRTVSEEITREFTTKGRLELDGELDEEIRSIITPVRVSQGGRVSAAPIEDTPQAVTRNFEQSAVIKGRRTSVENARRRATDDIYKNSKKYAKLINNIEEANKEGKLNVNTKNADAVKEYLLNVSKKLSNSVSRNEILNGQDVDHLVIASLGYVPDHTNADDWHLYGSTLNGFIEGNAFFHKRKDGVNSLFDFIAKKENIDKTIVNSFDTFDGPEGNKYIPVTNKFDDMYDYLLNKAAHEVYEDPKALKKALTLMGDTPSVSKYDLSGYFEFDVSNISTPDKYVQKDLKTLDSKDILRVNLDSDEEYKLVDKVLKLYKGDFPSDRDLQIQKMSSMKQFISHLQRTNKALFENNDELKSLAEDVNNAANGGLISPQGIANRLIRGLKQTKEQDPFAGIIKTDFMLAELGATDEKVIGKLNSYLADPEILNEAYNKTSSYTKLHKGNQQALIEDIVDKYFMPNVEGKTGKDALEAILAQPIRNKDQKQYTEKVWNHTRNTYLEHVQDLFHQITSGGGNIHANNNTIAMELNGKITSLDGIPKMKYDNGALFFDVNKNPVVAHLNLGWDNKRNDVKVESSLQQILDKTFTPYSKKKIAKEIEAGEFSVDTISLLTGRAQKRALEESAMTSFSLHEKMSLYRFGIGDAIVEHLDSLIGTEGNPGIWANSKTVDKDIISGIRKIVTSDNWKNLKEKSISPELKEKLIKNMTTLIMQTTQNEEVRDEIMPFISASNKETQVANSATDLQYGRYSQGFVDQYSNAQRPVTASQRHVFDRDKIEEGVKSYIERTKGKKDIFIGNVIDEEYLYNAKTTGGQAIKRFEQSVSVTKVNVGQIGLTAILDNNFKKVIEENDTIANLSKHEKELNFHRMKRKLNVFEQEKIVDARLVDDLYEMGDYVQMLDKDYLSWLKQANLEKDEKIISRLGQVKSVISLTDTGELAYKSQEGALVERGEVILKTIGFGNQEEDVSNKAFKGRLKYGIFETQDNVLVSDDKVTEFLNKNLQKIQSVASTYQSSGLTKEEALEKAAHELLADNFKSTFYVEDIRQKSYMKLINDGVEKDMAYAPYVSLGELDPRISQYLEGKKYQEKDLKEYLKDVVLTKNEIDTILIKNFQPNSHFKTAKELLDAINAERFYDSVSIFDHVKEFQESSMIAAHAVAKHSNDGMIFSNVLGSALSVYKKEADGDQLKAATKLRNKLIEYNVIDLTDDYGNKLDANDVLKVTNDGRLLHNTFKSNQAEMSENVLETVDNLNIKNLINMIKDDKTLKDVLYHQNVKVLDTSGELKHKTVESVIGDIVTTDIEGVGNVVIGSKNVTGIELAIDGEYMTMYDGKAIDFLNEKVKYDQDIVQQKLKLQKLKTKKAEILSSNGDTSEIDQYIHEVENNIQFLQRQKADLVSDKGGIMNVVRGKKVGTQEFGLYDYHVLNEGSVDIVNDFINKTQGNIDDNVLESFKASLHGVFTLDENGKYSLNEEFTNTKVLGDYMTMLKSKKLFKTVGSAELELKLDDDMLSLPEYAHLKDTYKDLKIVAERHIGKDAPISVRYAEEAYQVKSAHLSARFNEGLIKEESLYKQGFSNIHVDDLIVLGADAEKLGLDSMFTQNYVVDMGDFDKLALPKAGQVIGDNSIKEEFQKKMVGIKHAIDEYNNTYKDINSEDAQEAKGRVQNKIEEFKQMMNKSIYEKDGMIHDLSRIELEESFRLKSSTASVMDFEVRGEGTSAVEKSYGVLSANNKYDSKLMNKARINGKTLLELEQGGIYRDYMFVSNEVFENLGYYKPERIAQTLGVDIEEVNAKYDHYKGKMMDVLETHGDLYMAERYPSIWQDSDKPMIAFLDRDAKTNRVRFSMAAMLSMNGDNDGDSESAALYRAIDGKTFLEYQVAKENFIKENNLADKLANENTSKEALTMIDEAMAEKFEGSHKTFKMLEADMAIASVSRNAYHYGRGKDIMMKELQSAIDNGDINAVKAIRFNSLLGGRLYQNYGGTSSIEALGQNEQAVNNMISLAHDINTKVGNIFEGVANVPIHQTDNHMEHLNNTFAVFDAMQNPESYKLTNEQHANLLKAKEEFNVTDEMINQMRDDAVMKARWMDYQAETMAKARKGSIGSINVALQQQRQAVQSLHNTGSVEDMFEQLTIQHVAQNIEQEVISSKKGNVIFNVNKTSELVETYQKMWQSGANSTLTLKRNGDAISTTVRDSLTSWMNDNLGDDKIIDIVTQVQSSVGASHVKERFGVTAQEINDDNIGTVRAKLTNHYISTLDRMTQSNYGKDIRKMSRLGGNMVDSSNVVGLDGRTSTPRDMIVDYLTMNEYRTKPPSKSATHGIANTARTSSEQVAGLVTSIADSLSSMEIKGKNGLAVGALGFAAGILVSGFAGGPIDQTSASDYAQAENEKPQAVSVPTMMDNGGFATSSGGGGYIINVRANTNKDITNTKKLLRQAASASVGGGVSVNMNIKEKSERFTDRDLESMIAGIF